MNDKLWWHARCTKYPHDKALQARARELYPSLFFDDGRLCEADLVNFDTWDRQVVPAGQSSAYGRAA